MTRSLKTISDKDLDNLHAIVTTYNLWALEEEMAVRDARKKMHKKRLIRLADKLEGRGPYEKVGPVPKERFDMGTWVERRWSNSTHDFMTVLDEKAAKSCGTAACACGWAALDPYFKKQGLGVDAVGGGIKFTDEQNRKREDIEAAAAFFKIPKDDASALFYEESYQAAEDDGDGDNWKKVTPKMVAKRIRDYVSGNTKNIPL